MTGDLPCSICGGYWCTGHFPLQPVYPLAPAVPFQGTTTITWPPVPDRLHPDDIEKIARRVVELLKDKDAP